MRACLYGVAIAALAAATSPESLRSALAVSASTLFEATPFLFAAVAAAQLLRHRAIVDYLGCGCGAGPSARSIPATAAAWLLFGPIVGLARFIAALLVARALQRGAVACADRSFDLMSELAAVTPAAALAGAAMQTFALVDPTRLPPVASALLGAALGFVAPCGLGAVAVAGALRVHAPIAAAAFLAIAGIADLRSFARTTHARARHDALGYALLATALAVVAWRHGHALVHPAFTPALALCACGSACCAVAYRRFRCAGARAAPALMLFGALAGAPPPQYYATETTLNDLFAGEHLDFTGALVRGARASALVRYAIICCRADATPVAVRLAATPAYPSGTWLRVEGTIENRDGEFRLASDRCQRVAAPSDPFAYR